MCFCDANGHTNPVCQKQKRIERQKKENGLNQYYLLCIQEAKQQLLMRFIQMI